MGRIVLVGAGHAHLGVLAHSRSLTRRGHDVCLVTPGPFWYSGLATGVLGGRHAPARACIDAGALVRAAGGRAVRDRVVRIDPRTRTVQLAGGGALTWDAVSLDVGSEPAWNVPGAREHALGVKPIAGLVRLADDLGAAWRAGAGRRVLIVGGGPSGCEVAANVDGLARRAGVPVAVTILSRSARLLPTMAAGAGAALARALARRGIAVVTDAPVVRVEPGAVVRADGTRHDADVVVWATGLRPPPLAAASGLAVDDDGAMRVDAHLAALGHDRIFGGGDCIAFATRPLPRIGVHAVRQAPVLLANLAAAVEGRGRRRFVPARHALLILNLGDGTALAVRGRWWWRGRAALWLKDRIDRRWLVRHQSLRT